jgi:hypothetical protein
MSSATPDNDILASLALSHDEGVRRPGLTLIDFRRRNHFPGRRGGNGRIRARDLFYNSKRPIRVKRSLMLRCRVPAA